MKTTLDELFITTCSKYSENHSLIIKYWNEIEVSYSHKDRAYHNLDHLSNMIDELALVENEIEEKDSLLFAIFYHDIIYKSTSKHNEEKSAEWASIRLKNLNLKPQQISKVTQHIIATQKHEKSIDHDTNCLLDLDLAILGKDWNTYQNYIQQIRKEYALFPNFIYNPGRKKVLNHFLALDEIYKTDRFKSIYETQARTNITKEIDLL